MTETHGLGYALDHPLAVAAREDPRNWPMSLLMEGRPLAAVPGRWLDPGISLALDQDGVGACVAFGGSVVMDCQEARDEGSHLFASGTWAASAASTGAYRTYWDLKHGYRSFPGDGIPGAEGSYPEALWRLARAEGLVDRSGKRHRISAYYAHAFSGAQDLGFVQQVILALGPVLFGIPCPQSWFRAPAGPAFRMPAPSGPMAGGHAIACVGWETDPDGTVWLTFAQTWGRSWTDSRGLYRLRADWLWSAPLGPQVAWKAVDLRDAPVPPEPENAMITAAPDTAATPWDRLVDLAPGTVITAADGRRVPLTSGGTGVWSPFAVSPTVRAVRFSTGGVAQIGTVPLAACSNMRPRSGPAQADIDAARAAGYAAAKANATKAVGGI